MILPCPDSKHSFVLFAKQGCHWCGRNTLNPEMSNDDDGNDGDDNNHMIMTMMIGCVLECGLWHWVSLADRADCPDLVPSHELKIRRNSSDEDHEIMNLLCCDDASDESDGDDQEVFSNHQ